VKDTIAIMFDYILCEGWSLHGDWIDYV